METLNTTIRKNGFVYELIERSEYFAIYAQYIEDEIIAYEVFRIKIQKPRVGKFAGVEIQFVEKELFPSNEDFGYTAFTCRTLEKAEARLKEMTTAYEMKKHGINLN